MWSPSSDKKLIRGDYPLPDLIGSPVSSASSWTESPPLSPLGTTLDLTIETCDHDDDDDIRSNFLGGGDAGIPSSEGVCDFANLFPNSCQALTSPWIRVFDIDDTENDDVEYNSLAESRVLRYREMRVQYLGGDSSDCHAVKEPSSHRLPKRPESSQRIYPKKRRAVVHEMRDDSKHPLGFFHCSGLVCFRCFGAFKTG